MPPERRHIRRNRITIKAWTQIGEGFDVTGWATVDDLVEAIEDPTRRFALGVQWHPEASGGEEIAALVEAARA